MVKYILHSVLTLPQTVCLDRGMEPLEQAIEKAGGLSALANLIQTTPQAVLNWRKRGIPAIRVLAIEQATGISRHELRPDIYPIGRS